MYSFDSVERDWNVVVLYSEYILSSLSDVTEIKLSKCIKPSYV